MQTEIFPNVRLAAHTSSVALAKIQNVPLALPRGRMIMFSTKRITGGQILKRLMALYLDSATLNCRQNNLKMFSNSICFEPAVFLLNFTT
jgi:hypothetical protein